MNFKEAGSTEIDNIMKAARAAFFAYQKIPSAQKADFLDTIARNMDSLGDVLILKASEETNIPAARLMMEKNRTTNQLRSFANMLREGSWVDASIDTSEPERKPVPKPDLRKMFVPLGAVVVFGASNFPFAYSTAGGDTASALAAGCPVVVKAHQAHAETSELVAEAIIKAAKETGMPAQVFQHVHGAGFETGKSLVQHPATAAVGFTGSFAGGRALFDYANERKTLIPVFSEMGSVNPVVFLPEAMKERTEVLSTAFTASVTTGMGQFCTKPGLMFAMEGKQTDEFVSLLIQKVKSVEPAKMLHEGIHNAYLKNTNKFSSQAGVDYNAAMVIEKEEAIPAIAVVSGQAFIQNPLLHEEVFGPFALVVKCASAEELKQAWMSVAGQLTTTIIANDKDYEDHRDIVEYAPQMAGRIVFNGVPTGVEVCVSMVHGGPYPATTDSRFTAVGLSAVRRWIRPVCYQNCPDHLLPAALKNANPLNIFRLVNNVRTNNPL